MFSKNSLAELIATFFYVGKIQYCPGTFGSLAALGLYYMIVYFLPLDQIVFALAAKIIARPVWGAVIMMMIIASSAAIFAISSWAASVHARQIGNLDPREVVIDEVVGQVLTLMLCAWSVELAGGLKISQYFSDQMINFSQLIILPFGLFRWFDILKPWPISWLDNNITQGIGIMIDDVAAAVAAFIAHYLILLSISQLGLEA